MFSSRLYLISQNDAIIAWVESWKSHLNEEENLRVYISIVLDFIHADEVCNFTEKSGTYSFLISISSCKILFNVIMGRYVVYVIVVKAMVVRHLIIGVWYDLCSCIFKLSLFMGCTALIFGWGIHVGKIVSTFFLSVLKWASDAVFWCRYYQKLRSLLSIV